METEVNKTIPFLDVLVDNSQIILKTSTYHQSKYSGLLRNYTRFTSCLREHTKVAILGQAFMMMSPKLKTFSKEILIRLLF